MNDLSKIVNELNQSQVEGMVLKVAATINTQGLLSNSEQGWGYARDLLSLDESHSEPLTLDQVIEREARLRVKIAIALIEVTGDEVMWAEL